MSLIYPLSLSLSFCLSLSVFVCLPVSLSLSLSLSVFLSLTSRCHNSMINSDLKELSLICDNWLATHGSKKKFNLSVFELFSVIAKEGVKTRKEVNRCILFICVCEHWSRLLYQNDEKKIQNWKWNYFHFATSCVLYYRSSFRVGPADRPWKLSLMIKI